MEDCMDLSLLKVMFVLIGKSTVNLARQTIKHHSKTWPGRP